MQFRNPRVWAAVRVIAATGVLSAASYFVRSGRWLWPPLPVAPPIVVSESFTETLDTLRWGETLSELFARQGLPLPALPSLQAFDPRRLRAGLIFRFRRGPRESQPSRVIVRTGPDERVTLRQIDAAWTAEVQPIHWTSEATVVEGTIENSLYEALDRQMDSDVLRPEERVRLAWDLADVFAWEVDFARDLRPGDHFRVLFERSLSEEGEVRFGRVLAAELSVGGRDYAGYRFAEDEGRSSFYDAQGVSLHRAFLRAPLAFRRVSSRFTYARMHPILGIMRRHEGTDYAADPGTPVEAAGDGWVSRAGWSDGYGNLIELRHQNGIVTRYGHLEAFARGIRVGNRVMQGETIGYVGSTGLATGPHLHYEFRINGIARDPRAVDLGSGDPIPGRVRPAFDLERARLAQLLDRPGSRPRPALVRAQAGE